MCVHVCVCVCSWRQPMRVDWCVSSWFRIKNTHTHSHASRGKGNRQKNGERGSESRKQPSWTALVSRVRLLLSTPSMPDRARHATLLRLLHAGTTPTAVWYKSAVCSLNDPYNYLREVESERERGVWNRRSRAPYPKAQCTTTKHH